MKIPENLKPGDFIGIAATARKISEKEITGCVQYFEEKGYRTKLAKNIFNENFQFAGTDEERCAGLQKLIDDDEVKAIILARGGYGTVRLIDKINFKKFAVKPKWLMGFSDATVLFSKLETLDIAALHGPMAVNFISDESSNFYIEKKCIDTVSDMLEGKNSTIHFDLHPLNRKGNCKGKLVGGNLSVLYAQSGSSTDINTENKILFLEDIDEYLYHFDRMIQWLKRSGKLENIAGLIIGGLDKMKNLDEKNPFGKTAEEIIFEAIENYNYPVAYNFPAGHGKTNFPFVINSNIELNINYQSSTINYR